MTNRNHILLIVLLLLLMSFAFYNDLSRLFS
jgi:membrane-associated protease RseP (regulator of RpoE activity)